MIEEIGIVTAIAGDRVSVMCTRAALCGACGAARQCGSSILQNLFGRRQQGSLDALDPLGARLGDRVVVGISEKNLQRGSWVVFFVPLVGLLGITILVDQVVEQTPHGELATIIGGLTGLIVGLLLARRIGESLFGKSRCHAQILHIVRNEPE